MAEQTSTLGSIGGGIIATIFAVVRSAALLVVELITAILLYVYLDLFHQDLFGSLVRTASELFNAIASAVIPIFQDSANQAYASLIGELSPKAILLLFIGLAVGAVIRFIVWTMSRLSSSVG